MKNSKGGRTIGIILLIVLIVLLVGSMPTWPYSSGWGYYPSGGLTFSYPLTSVRSNFRGFSDSPLVSFTPDELIEAFDSIKRLKKHIRVVNPNQSLEEMKRFVKKEEQRFPCLGGYRYFYLDWNLDFWRCHFWHSPLCSVFEFDGSQRINDGCTECMVDCFRDASVMHHLGVEMVRSGQDSRMTRGIRSGGSFLNS